MTTHSSRLPLLAAGALLLLSLAGCGSSADPKEAAKPARKVDACALLTEADATAALGEPVNAMSSVLSGAKGNDPLQCAYNGGVSDPPKTLSLLIRPSDSRAAARRLYDATRSGLTSLVGASVPQDVAGLGDAAFWVGGQLNQLHVLTGELHLIFTAQPGTGGDAKTVATAVAGKVMTRL